MPTIADAVPGLAVQSWCGLYAPAGTPLDVIDKLNAAAKKAAQVPDFVKQVEQEDVPVVASDPAELGR